MYKSEVLFKDVETDTLCDARWFLTDTKEQLYDLIDEILDECIDVGFDVYAKIAIYQIAYSTPHLCEITQEMYEMFEELVE